MYKSYVQYYTDLRFFHDDPAVSPFWDMVVPNYDDNQLYCGGLGPQIGNDYKCGVCGDNYKDARPRPNELGGKYGMSGIIPRTYSTGEVMDVEVQITTHHQGIIKLSDFTVILRYHL